MRAFLVGVVVFGVGCVTAEKNEPRPPQPTATASAPPVDPDAKFAPMPYTAAQIRSGSPAGRTLTFVIETPNKPPFQRRVKFMAADDEHATIQSEMLAPDGKVVGEPEMEVASWEQLRHHAAYPKESTTVTDSVALTPSGNFPCKRYTVLEKTPKGEKRTIVCFAKEMPGPPVELSVEIGGELVMSMSLLKNEPGGS